MIKEKIKHEVGNIVESVGQHVRRAWGLVVQVNGGWGRQVEAALRRRLADDPRAATVKSLVLDTDVNGMDGYGPGQAYPLIGVPIRQLLTRMLRQVKAYSQYRALFGDYLNKLWQTIGAIDDIDQGAMMSRVLGMAALLWHLERHPELRAFLLKQIRALNRYKTGDGRCSGNGRLADGDAAQWTVFTWFCQVQSLMGGNGSAIAQPLADVLKHLLRQQGMRHRFISINALPSVFGNLFLMDEDRLRAHAYASLLERMLRWERPLAPWEAGQAGQVERDGPVYEIAYYLEGFNMHGKAYDDPEAVAAVAAEFIRMTLLGGPLAERYTGLTQNQFRRLQPPYIGASFGVFVFEIPIDEIIRQFGFWLSRLGIKRLLRAFSQSEMERLATEHVGRFTTQSGLQNRGEWFRMTRRKQKIKPNLVQFRVEPRAHLPQLLENYELKQFPAWQREIDRLVEAKYQDLADYLDELVTNLVNSVGLRQARQVLDQPAGACLTRTLAGLKTGVGRQLERQHQQLDIHMRREGRRRSLPTWRKLTPVPRERYETAKQTEFDLKVSFMQLTGQLEVFTRLEEYAQSRARELDGWIRALEELVKRLKGLEGAFAQERRDKPEIIQYALCPQEERDIFEDHIGQMLNRYLDSLSFERDEGQLILHYPTDQPELVGQQQRLLTEEGIHDFLSYASSLWGFLRKELSIEAVLKERGEDAVELLERWFRYAAPLINIEEIDQEQPLTHTLLLGSQYGGDGFWQGVSTPYLTIERTGDPFRIECLYALFGINPFALAQTQAMRADYERLRANGEPLHIYPESELEGDDQEAAPKSSKVKNKKKKKGGKSNA